MHVTSLPSGEIDTANFHACAGLVASLQKIHASLPHASFKFKLMGTVLVKQKQQGCQKRVLPSKVELIVQLVTTRADVAN